MEVIDRHEQVQAALESGDDAAIRAEAGALHPADAAGILTDLDDDQRRQFVNALPVELLARLIAYLPDPDLVQVLGFLSLGQQARILNELPDDDLVDVLQSFEEDERNRLLRFLPDSKKQLAHQLLHYPEDSAGGRMTTALAAVRPEMTIREAIEQLRDRAEHTEVLSRIFVVDDQGRLLGKVRLRDLTFNRRSTLINDVMMNETIAVKATADQEEAVLLMSRYDLGVLPVVDDAFRLIGLITHDDALEIQEEESTEDLERQSGISGESSDEAYLDTPVLLHIRRRFGWVLFLALVAIISGLVILKYEQVLDRYFVLAIYMPMVVAAGGNTGGQAATMVIRAMSLGEFTPSAILKVAWKEARVGILIGGLLGICIALQIRYLMPFESILPAGKSFLDIAITVGVALTVQITASTLVGATLPIMAKSMRLDPAVVASPAITTVVDVTGLLIYFSLAKSILGI